MVLPHLPDDILHKIWPSDALKVAPLLKGIDFISVLDDNPERIGRQQYLKYTVDIDRASLTRISTAFFKFTAEERRRYHYTLTLPQEFAIEIFEAVMSCCFQAEALVTHREWPDVCIENYGSAPYVVFPAVSRRRNLTLRTKKDLARRNCSFTNSSQNDHTIRNSRYIPIPNGEHSESKQLVLYVAAHIKTHLNNWFEGFVQQWRSHEWRQRSYAVLTSGIPWTPVLRPVQDSIPCIETRTDARGNVVVYATYCRKPSHNRVRQQFFNAMRD